MFKKAIEVGAQVRELQSEGKPIPEDLQKIFDASDEPVYQMVPQPVRRKDEACRHRRCADRGRDPRVLLRLRRTSVRGLRHDRDLHPGTSNNAITGYRSVRSASPSRAAPSGSPKTARSWSAARTSSRATTRTMPRPPKRSTVKAGSTPATSAMIDDDGFVFITGRKKDIIITAGGKNLTPANFENAMKQNRWVSQAVMYGDRRPYPVAIVTLDHEELPGARRGARDRERRQHLQQPEGHRPDPGVVDEVNTKFAQVEQVKKFRILPHDLTIETGELTPSMKVKRNVVHEKYADIYAAMYNG